MAGYFKHQKRPKTIRDEEEYTKGSKPGVKIYWSSYYLPKNKSEEYETSLDKNCKIKKSWSIISIPVFHTTELEIMFNELSEKWKDDTGLYSTTTKKVVNDAYLDIIGLGKDVVPFILKDMKNGGPAHWHAALKALTKENPVSDHDLNKNKKIRDAWLRWGETKNLI